MGIILYVKIDYEFFMENINILPDHKIVMSNWQNTVQKDMLKKTE